MDNISKEILKLKYFYDNEEELDMGAIDTNAPVSKIAKTLSKKYGGFHVCDNCAKPIKNGGVCECEKDMGVE